MDAVWWGHPIDREGCAYVKYEPCSGVVLRNLLGLDDKAVVGRVEIGGAEGEQYVEDEKYIDGEIDHYPAQAPPM